MLPRNFLQTLKYSERFLAEGKDPSKGYLWKSFHVPCSDLGLHTEQQMASGDALHIKLPPWHRIPPKPPWHFSESEPRIWLWGRVSGEDRFDHSARVDAVLVKACCIAPGSESDNYYIVSQGCRLAGPCLRRFGQHTAISTLCSYFPRWWSAGLGLVSIRATSTLRLLTSNFSLACKSVSPHVEWPLNQYCCRFLIQSSSLRINQEHCMVSQ